MTWNDLLKCWFIACYIRAFGGPACLRLVRRLVSSEDYRCTWTRSLHQTGSMGSTLDARWCFMGIWQAICRYVWFFKVIIKGCKWWNHLSCFWRWEWCRSECEWRYFKIVKGLILRFDTMFLSISCSFAGNQRHTWFLSYLDFCI